jgi:hypothetical protein
MRLHRYKVSHARVSINADNFLIYLRAYLTAKRPVIKQARTNVGNKTDTHKQKIKHAV